jgi:outer membrane protein OmpU
MKNTLLGTTALVAAGVMAGQAAAEGVELGLGGYYRAAAGANVSEDFYTGFDDPRWGAFRQDVEVYMHGSYTLDNGMTVGAMIQLEGQQSGDQIDEVWAYFQGGFGEIRFGDDDDAMEQLSYGIPAAGMFGVDSPWFSFSNAWHLGYGYGTNSTYKQLSGDATKILYFSPSFGGFTFGVSYAPDRRGEDCYFGFTSVCGSLMPGGTTFANNAGQVSEVFSAAISFAHDFNGFGMYAGIGGAIGELEKTGLSSISSIVTGGTTTFTIGASTGRDDEVWALRGDLGFTFGGWTIGGATAYVENAGAQFKGGGQATVTDSETDPPTSVGMLGERDVWTYGVGITYNWDAWTVGFGWSGGQYYDLYGPGGDGELNVFRLEAAYALGPGVNLGAAIGYDDWDAKGGSTANCEGGDTCNGISEAGSSYDSWSIMTGFHIGF